MTSKYFPLFLLPVAISLRVLSVLPSTTRSHYLPGRRVNLELLRRGHEVVVISPFAEQQMVNLTWIPVEVKTIFDAVPKLKKQFGKEFTFFGYQKYVWDTMNSYVEHITRLTKLTVFLKNDTSNFDVVFVHEFFQPIFYVLAYKYNAPLVAISTFGHAQYIHNYMSSYLDCSIPHEFSNLQHPLGALDTIKNIIYITYDLIGRRYFLLQKQNAFVEDVFGVKDAPHLIDLEKRINIVLVNSHHATSIIRSSSPNIVDIGGVHIEDVKPLNEELRDILDGAKHGAVLFSLGSILELNSQKENFINDVLNVLASLKQRVIIKWNSKRDISFYKNIYAYPWLPQNDILAHPNLVLFVSHGGELSNQEAVTHAVPIICIPFQATQPHVCRSSTKLGYAIHIPKGVMTAEVLNGSIQRILSDRTFKDNALQVSRRFKDRPMSPLDTAVFYIEYATRNRILGTNEGNSCMFLIYSWLLLLSVIVFVCKFFSLTRKYIKKNWQRLRNRY